MWATSQHTFSDGNRAWIEVGYENGALVSNGYAGKCFYWAIMDDSEVYTDYRIAGDSDTDGTWRGYQIQRDPYITNKAHVYIDGYEYGAPTNFSYYLYKASHGYEATFDDASSTLGTQTCNITNCEFHSFGYWYYQSSSYMTDSNTNSDSSQTDVVHTSGSYSTSNKKH